MPKDSSKTAIHLVKLVISLHMFTNLKLINESWIQKSVIIFSGTRPMKISPEYLKLLDFVGNFQTVT